RFGVSEGSEAPGICCWSRPDTIANPPSNEFPPPSLGATTVAVDSYILAVTRVHTVPTPKLSTTTAMINGRRRQRIRAYRNATRDSARGSSITVPRDMVAAISDRIHLAARRSGQDGTGAQ